MTSTYTINPLSPPTFRVKSVDRTYLSSFKIGKGVIAEFTRENNCNEETEFGKSFKVIGPYNLPSLDDFNSDVLKISFNIYDPVA